MKENTVDLYDVFELLIFVTFIFLDSFVIDIDFTWGMFIVLSVPYLLKLGIQGIAKIYKG